MKPEKHGRGLEEAEQALHTFASVGAGNFDLTQTDLDGNKRSFVGYQKLEVLQRRLPELMESAARRQYNVIVRPRAMDNGLVQLDDLDRGALKRCQGCAFLILTTSPENHQAWIAVQHCTEELARRLRRGNGADASASGATRLPGSINYKRKYAPEFPTVRILQAAPQRVASRRELEALGLLAPPDVHPKPPGRVSPDVAGRRWPSYQRCVQNAPLAHGADRPDISRADFTFCLIAIDWGWSLTEVTTRLLAQSSKARENGARYAKLTVERAAAAAARRGGLNNSEIRGKHWK